MVRHFKTVVRNAQPLLRRGDVKRMSANAGVYTRHTLARACVCVHVSTYGCVFNECSYACVRVLGYVLHALVTISGAIMYCVATKSSARGDIKKKNKINGHKATKNQDIHPKKIVYRSKEDEK